MKKTITFITAMLIAAAAFTGCNSSSNGGNTSDKLAASDSFEQATEASADNIEKVIDVFENIDYSIVENTYYPNGLKINFDASNTPFGQKMKFTYFVESANREEIVIIAKANIDDVDDIIRENNYTINETEKIFTISIDQINSCIISPNQLIDENKTKILDEMKQGIISKMSDISLTPEKLYLLAPKEDAVLKAVNRKTDSSLVLDENSFEDFYLNTCEITISSGLSFYIFGTFSDSNNNYYCSAVSPLLPKDSSLSFDYVSATEEVLVPENVYSDEQSAFDSIFNSYYIFFDEEQQEVIEIPFLQ